MVGDGRFPTVVERCLITSTHRFLAPPVPWIDEDHQPAAFSAFRGWEKQATVGLFGRTGGLSCPVTPHDGFWLGGRGTRFVEQPSRLTSDAGIPSPL